MKSLIKIFIPLVVLGVLLYTQSSQGREAVRAFFAHLTTNSTLEIAAQTNAPFLQKAISTDVLERLSADQLLTADEVIDATNKERIKAGLTPFRVNSKLGASAQVKVSDMIAQQYFEHVSPSGLGVADLGKAQEYDYIIIGENLALGDFTDASDLVGAWMKSPGHRANILNRNYQELGVAVSYGLYQGKYVWLAVQHFGTERNVCPLIDQALKVSIKTANDDLEAREALIAAIRSKIESPDRPQGDELKALIVTFNTLVQEYNNRLAIVQDEIARYNIQINAFNKCLALYQKN